MRAWRLIALGLLMAGVVQPAFADPSDLFPMSRGRWWKYTSPSAAEVTVTVTSIDDSVYTLESRSDLMVRERDRYTTDGGWLRLEQRTSATSLRVAAVVESFTPPRPLVKLENPQPGDRWVWFRTGPPAVKETFTIVETTPVKVVAGTFFALHIHEEDSDGAGQEDNWYAEHVGLIKRQVTRNGVTSSMELTDSGTP